MKSNLTDDEIIQDLIDEMKEEVGDIGAGEVDWTASDIKEAKAKQEEYEYRYGKQIKEEQKRMEKCSLMTKNAIKGMCIEKGIKGYSRLNKIELIEKCCI